MKSHTYLLISCLCLLGLSASLSAQDANLSSDSGSTILNNQSNTTALATGDVLQFGYYTGATTNSLFAGTWVPLTGDGGANSGLSFTVIGQTNGAANGQFSYVGLVFTQGNPTTGVNLPNAGQIMGIRFYNGATINTSGYYGAVSDASWTWIAAAPPTMTFGLDDEGTTWLNGYTAYTGNILAVPEPSTSALTLLALAAGAVVFLRSRRTS